MRKLKYTETTTEKINRLLEQLKEIEKEERKGMADDTKPTGPTNWFISPEDQKARRAKIIADNNKSVVMSLKGSKVRKNQAKEKANVRLVNEPVKETMVLLIDFENKKLIGRPGSGSGNGENQ